MKRNLILTGVLAALIGAGVTWKVASDHAAPVYVHAQDKQSVSLTFAPLVKKALPAVVNVESIVRSTQTRGPRRAPQGMPPEFGEFFGAPQEPRRGGGIGSGVIVTSDGYILTNNHVVEGATEVKVSTSDRREFQAKVVGTDPKTDIAVLKIDGKNLSVLPISDSGRVQVGDIALAIGDPFGIGQTVTMGIISAIGRGGLNPENYEDFIQTDAAINPGNSGGALINTSGELIGINTAILSRNGGNQGIGFAIPVNMAREVMDQIVQKGKVSRGYMGAGVQDVTQEIARAFGLPSSNGSLITTVQPDSPAERAGMKAGDVVTAINGDPVQDAASLRLRISRTAPGTTVKLSVQRTEGQRELTIALGTLPTDKLRAGIRGGEDSEEAPGSADARKGSNLQGLGLGVTDLTADIGAELELPRGTKGIVVSRVQAGSPASEAGMRRGDVITQVNRKPVASVDDLDRIAGTGNGPVVMLVTRGQGSVFVVIQPSRR